jgi:hypothetical protein
MTTLYGREALEELVVNVPEYVDLTEGASLKVNHVSCSAGTDTRKRFGVKLVDEAYLFHCFNCGDSGYYRTRETVKRMRLDGGDVSAPKGISVMHTIYQSSTTDYDAFDLRGQLWLAQYGFDDIMCMAYGIRECDVGIILPMFKFGTLEMGGYQLRRYDKKPKYLTYRGNTKAQLLRGHKDKPLVIVEDLLSSYKLNYAGYNSLCLMGTSLSLKTIEELHIDRGVRVVLWLDDDEAGHAGTLKLYKELAPLFNNHVTSINMQQPKEIDIDKLIEMEL